MNAINILIIRGERIKAARVAAGMTQTEAAGKIGISQALWCRYENGTVKGAKVTVFEAMEKVVGLQEHNRRSGDVEKFLVV
jgi:transcriptional regulator with XRE-family HTH domain